jgi:hypothetical protein
MTNQIEQRQVRTGDHLRKLVKFGSIGGLIFSLIGTGLIWAGTDSFNCSTLIWKANLALNLIIFALAWILYIPFRNTDLLLGNGLIMMTVLFNMFSTFGLGGFYFYFLFAPINISLRAVILISMTAILFHRAFQIRRDIDDAFLKNKKLLNKMYCDEGSSITFKREAIGLLERSRKERKPFNSIHTYAAILIAPFVLVLNKSLTPIVGEGHGVFLVLAFFSIPMMLWGVDLYVQTAISMVCYPIKLRRETGKMTILKDW